MDAKCVYQQWNWITVAKYFGTPPADWVHGYLYFEPGAWIWTKGFRRYLHIVKNWSGKFSLHSSRVRALGLPLLGIFSGFFWFFLGGSVGLIIYREYIEFRGSNISCSLACWVVHNASPAPPPCPQSVKGLNFSLTTQLRTFVPAALIWLLLNLILASQIRTINNELIINYLIESVNEINRSVNQKLMQKWTAGAREVTMHSYVSVKEYSPLLSF